MSTLNALVLKTLSDLKAEDLKTLNVQKLTSMTDTMIIATGTSSRHTQALYHAVRIAIKKHDQRSLRVEGEKSGEWILIDLGVLIVHIMQESIRDFYDLEKLWRLNVSDSCSPTL
jgi:ribosome-associated protein